MEMNDRGYEPAGTWVGFWRFSSPNSPRSSTSIAFIHNHLAALLPCRHKRPNTVHLPIRRREAELGSPFHCHYLETPQNREMVSRGATLWQILHGRLINYTHSQPLKLLGIS